MTQLSPTLYTLLEVAHLLAYSVVTVRRLIHAGHLEAYHVGRIYRVSDEQLQAYLTKCKLP